MNIRSKELRKAVQEAKAEEEKKARERRIEELEKAIEPYLVGEFSYKIKVTFKLGYSEILYDFEDEKFGPDFIDCDYFSEISTYDTDPVILFWVVYSTRQNETQIDLLLNNIRDHLNNKFESMYTTIHATCVDQMEDFHISDKCPKKLLDEYNNRYKVEKIEEEPKEIKPVVKIR